MPADRAAPFTTLRRFARSASPAPEPVTEQCELCAQQVASEHRHLLEPAAGAVHCVCYPCSILFAEPAASEGRYLLIPDRRLALAEFALDEPTWARLHIPVGIAFFVLSSTSDGEPVAYYPGPMGAARAYLPSAAWTALVSANPVLEELCSDVEALLIDRRAGHTRAFLVPIDDCFRLVAVMRRHWRGLSGGVDVWRAIDDFLDTLTAAAKPGPRPPPAPDAGGLHPA